MPGNVLLSQRGTLTTIGAEKLNFRVRDGNGCDLLAIATRLYSFRTILLYILYFKRIFHSLKTR